MSDSIHHPLAVSIVIPAFNEADRIRPFLTSIAAWISSSSTSYEVIIVDDGSTDSTVEVARNFEASIPLLRVVSLPTNRGKGAAVRYGFEIASGAHRIFLDADGSTPITEVDTLLAATNSSDRVVALGSVAVKGAEVEVRQVALRQWAGRFGNRLIQWLAVPDIGDTQRGCKLVSARWCEEVLPHCVVDGWAFDVEWLMLSRACGYRLAEVPIQWHHVDGTKVTAFSYLRTLIDVVAIRRRVLRLEASGVLPTAS